MERKINNDFYDTLGEQWYQEDAHPIALLRAENQARNPWILEKIEEHCGKNAQILDIGCGAGLLSNALAFNGYDVTGIDLSKTSLELARQRDETKRVKYLQKDAKQLDFPEGSFDVVCAMDFLEHVEDPEQIIKIASYLLKTGGLFFFHTFNRNFLSYIVVIKGVEWLVPNTPKDMHLYSLFIKPKELKGWCQNVHLEVKQIQGLVPKVNSLVFWKSLFTRKVAKGFPFQLTSSLKTGYLGFAVKK